MNSSRNRHGSDRGRTREFETPEEEQRSLPASLLSRRKAEEQKLLEQMLQADPALKELRPELFDATDPDNDLRLPGDEKSYQIMV